jgi:Tol biopolymer transport system component
MMQQNAFTGQRLHMHLSRVLLPLLLSSIVGCRSTQPYQAPFSKAVFHPNGTQVAFTVAKGGTCFIYQADLKTGSAKRISHAQTGCETDPAYAPDGKHLAYILAPKPGMRGALVYADLNGGSPQTLAADTEDNLKPFFAPDSSRVFFLRSGAFEHHSPLVDNRRHAFDLFSVDLATRRVDQLTHQRFYELDQVDVSADGKLLAYSLSTYPEGDRFLIAPVDTPEKPTAALQPIVPRAPGPTPVLYKASWFPDGRSLLFMAASEPPSNGNFDYNAYRVSLGSGKIEQLTVLKGQIGALSLSRDGRKAILLQGDEYSLLDVDTHKLTSISIHYLN